MRSAIPYEIAVGANGNNVILPNNPARVSLLLCPPTSGFFFFRIGHETAGSGLGIAMSSNATPLVLSKEDFGDWVNRQVSLWNTGSAQVANIVEGVEEGCD